MNILVTGANGQVGWELERQGTKSQHQVFSLNREQLNITDKKQIQQRIDEHQPDVIINAAAYTEVDQAESNQEVAYAINQDGAMYLARAANDADIPLFHISTDYVFDGNKDSAYMESDLTAPLSVYGMSKRAGDIAIQENLKKHIILRTSWVFGLHGHNFVKTILRLASERNELNIVSDQFGCPTSAAGIAFTLLKLCDKLLDNGDLTWGTYHYAGNSVTSWYEFAEAIIKIAREQGKIDHEVIVHPITTSEYPTIAKRPVNSSLVSKLIKEKLGIEPDDWSLALMDMLKS